MNIHSDHAHCGDLQWSAHFLHKLGGEHTLRCKPEYVEPLRELVSGTDITIDDCSNVPTNSRDCWIASGQYEHRGVRYEDNVDILGFVMRYFNAMAEDGGYEGPFKTREDMLCEWTSILNLNAHSELSASLKTAPPSFTGILVINADPKSGQCPGYSSSEMDALIQDMKASGNSVYSIDGTGLSLAQIGALSIHAKLIVGCATGPWWPCMNVWNKNTQRICMLHPMRLDYGSVPIVHARNAEDVKRIMEGMGFL